MKYCQYVDTVNMSRGIGCTTLASMLQPQQLIIMCDTDSCVTVGGEKSHLYVWKR